MKIISSKITYGPKICFEYRLQDLWIGIYWKKSYSKFASQFEEESKLKLRYDIWICLLPCLPIHILWERTFTCLEEV